MRFSKTTSGALTLLVVLSCQPQLGEPVLDQTVSPKTIDDQGQVATVEIVGTDGAGKVGTGALTVTSAAGSLSAGQTLEFDAYGKVTTTFSCDVALDSKCVGTVRVVAEWTSNGVPVIAETRVTVGGEGTGAGAGGGSGAGLGSTGGGAGGGSGLNTVMVLGSTGTISGIAPIDSPTSYRIGLPIPYHAVIRPNGRIAYIKEQPLAFLEFTVDQFVRTATGGSAAPNVLANDPRLPTPMCGTTSLPNEIGDFWVRPDTSAIVYQCGLMTKNRFEGTQELTAFDGFELLQLGPQKAALMTTSTTTVVRNEAGADAVSAYPRIVMGRRDTRSRPDGFWVASGDATLGCSLKLLKFDGTVQTVGTYAAPPATVTIPSTSFCAGKIDTDGTLLSIVMGAVVRRPLSPGVASVPYDTSGLPARDFTRFPPSTYVSPLLLIATP